MLLVPTYVAKSELEGFGLFAKEAIPKGTPIWKFTPGFDLMLHVDFMQHFLSDTAREQVIHYGHREGNLYYLDSDDARFFNSVPDCNTETVAEGYDGTKEIIPNHIAVTRAARDIAAGEEITCNYAEFYGAYDPVERVSKL